jgi:hypothetical protein
MLPTNFRAPRTATMSLGGLLAVAFWFGGVAAAQPEQDLFFLPDLNSFTETSLTTKTVFGYQYEQEKGYGPLDGYASPWETTTPVLPDGLQADATITPLLAPIPLGGPVFTYDITVGDAAIPTGTVIDMVEFPGFAVETVEAEGLGLLGLPEITETIFSQFGDFSF